VQNLNAKRLQRASSRPGRFPVAPPYLRRAHSSPKTPSVDRNVVQGTHQSGEQTGQICTPGLHLFLGGMWLARRLIFAASFARVGWLDGRLSTTADAGEADGQALGAGCPRLRCTTKKNKISSFETPIHLRTYLYRLRAANGLPKKIHYRTIL